jgi:hypothetical protein
VLLGPAPRAAEDLLREDAAADGDLHRVHGRDVEALPVETRRRRGRGGQPVEHHVVEQLVACEHVLRVAVAVHPAPELLEDPGGLAGGRVDEPVAHRLRAGALLLRVARVLVRVVLHARERGLLGRRQVVHRVGVRRHDRHVEMDRGAVVGILDADARRDHRAPVTALCEVAVVAESLHELGPDVGDLLHAPARLCGLAREAVARKRRTHDVKGVLGIAAVSRRVRERTDHLLELHDRAGPAVGQQQRTRALVW